MTDTTPSGGERPAAQAGSALGGLGERRQVRVAGVVLSGRRRRPSGEKPPLPRELTRSGRIWLLMGALIAVLWITLFAFPATTDWWTRLDNKVLQWLVDRRADGLTDVMKGFHALGSVWFIRPLRWVIMGTLAGMRRFRILFGVVVAFSIVDTLQRELANGIGRPRPLVEIIGDWVGYSHPSAPVGFLAVTVVVAGLAVIPKGRWRKRWFIFSAGLVGLLAISRLYLGIDHPTDVIIGWLLGPVVAVLVFRWVAPESVFPVNYRRARGAHLDISGDRGLAIEKALREQLGLTVLSIEPFGLEGSGGSTPLRIHCGRDPDCYLFAKLYARNHLRADRWYKVARTILVGSLEDEVRFASVRSLVEYEDYMLLKMQEADLPSPEPFGFVEITPEREYLIVTEFLDGATELGDADVDDAVIDDALMVMRKLWDAGLAHRDIKPANVMVREGRIVLIDPAFATVRPSPWRQAVDLANMMIILALRSSAEHVYDRTLRFFSPEDIAEAFSATRGMTIPTQSRSSLALLKRTQGIDIVEQFRDLAPDREPISMQRWSLRRLGLTLGAAAVLTWFVTLVFQNLIGAGFV
ncbi:MAG: phosphatase PAP2 family protein [Acidobacteria bacterium]|nr:phosphatase PAP2 family protein [Acidobacteriota bacterium]